MGWQTSRYRLRLHKFKDEQDSAGRGNGFLKPYEAFTKDCQGSDDEIEVWEFEEINGEQVRDES